MKAHKVINEIDTSDKKYHVVGYSLWHDIIPILSEYIAEKLFFNDGYHILILVHRKTDFNRFIESMSEDINYYTSEYESNSNTFTLDNSSVTIIEDIKNISQDDIKDKYDIFLVHNNALLDNETQLLALEDIGLKSIVTTLDYKDCIFYMCKNNKYVIEDPLAKENLISLNKSDADSILTRGVLAYFDAYANEYHSV